MVKSQYFPMAPQRQRPLSSESMAFRLLGLTMMDGVELGELRWQETAGEDKG
jgi:hypothetical protein